jgi:mRNA-degrading endonuclease YafQ of YafQ-DinJ toxin-antitoxin module
LKRRLLRTDSFIRASKKFLKHSPDQSEAVLQTLILLSENAFHPNLKTHKLKGDLKDSWACSARYDIRIVFSFISYDNHEAILLESIGTHDEVY